MKIATDIVWDTDGEEVMLPETVRINFPIEDDDIADALADGYGFCVKSFCIEECEEDE